MSRAVPHGYCHCGCGEKTPLSTATRKAQGHVKGQPYKYKRGHAHRPRNPHPYEIQDRGHETPCWIWLQTISRDGYGWIKRDGWQGNAHRWYFAQARGPLDAGAEVDHLCRVRACVNPAHMQLVTPAENSRRGAKAKLTYETVAEIRQLAADGHTYRALARRYGVHPNTISAAARGITWSAPGGVLIE